MIGNYDIEVAFMQANVRLNEQINRAQQQFYKTEIDRQQAIMQAQMKRKPATADTLTAVSGNPLSIMEGV